VPTRASRSPGCYNRQVHIDENTVLDVSRGTVTVRWGEESQVLRYNEVDELREAAQGFVSALVEAERHALFPHVCSSCGECCRREDVLVTSQEVFRLARQMGHSDEEFRTRYMREAPTWNPEDGYLKRDEGRCVFLRETSGVLMTRCAVYENRPFSCRAFMPVSPMCVKPPGTLVEHLTEIRIQGNVVAVASDGPVRIEIDAVGRPWHSRMVAFVERVRLEDEARENRFTQVANGLAKILQEIKNDFAVDPTFGKAYRQFMEARGVVNDLAGMVELSEADAATQTALLEGLWQQVRELDQAIAFQDIAPEHPRPSPNGNGRHAEPPPAPEVKAAPTSSLASLTVFPELVLASLVHQGAPAQCSLPLQEHPRLVAPVRALLSLVARWETADVAAALEDENPPCFLCGECCRHYAVEITPTDIARLAQNLNFSEADLIERYTVPGRFSWNEGNRVLRKTEHEGRRQCVFLEHRADGFFYCGVHEFKPGVCAGYLPTNKLCRRTNDAQYWSRQINNILWLFIEGHNAHLCTTQTHLRNLSPILLDLRRRKPALEAASALSHAAQECIAEIVARFS